jgi:uncharacterized SAM-binding protein YcdF (DUF218 family)
MDGTETTGQQSGGPEAAPVVSRPHVRSRRRLRVAAVALGLVALGLVAGFGLFANYVSLLKQPADPNTADAIIVLTGGQSRLSVALDLLKSHKGKRLLISGVNPLAGRKALSEATGGDEDLFYCCVDIDHAALDTVGNAEQSAKWVRAHDYASVILVTNNYHMPRSLLEMHRLLRAARVQPYPVVNSRLDDGSWLTNPATLRVLVTEYAKYLVALARGLLPAPVAEPEHTQIVSAAAG